MLRQCHPDPALKFAVENRTLTYHITPPHGFTAAARASPYSGSFARAISSTARSSARKCWSASPRKSSTAQIRSSVYSPRNALTWIRVHGLHALFSRILTPGPPPLASMNSTPAASRARLMARLLGAVIDVSPTASSARRMVVAPTDDAFARSAALQRIRALAARIWALVKGGGMLTKFSTWSNLLHLGYISPRIGIDSQTRMSK
jgi:hypothetical protein